MPPPAADVPCTASTGATVAQVWGYCLAARRRRRRFRTFRTACPRKPPTHCTRCSPPPPCASRAVPRGAGDVPANQGGRAARGIPAARPAPRKSEATPGKTEEPSIFPFCRWPRVPFTDAGLLKPPPATAIAARAAAPAPPAPPLRRAPPPLSAGGTCALAGTHKRWERAWSSGHALLAATHQPLRGPVAHKVRPRIARALLWLSSPLRWRPQAPPRWPVGARVHWQRKSVAGEGRPSRARVLRLGASRPAYLHHAQHASELYYERGLKQTGTRATVRWTTTAVETTRGWMKRRRGKGRRRSEYAARVTDATTRCLRAAWPGCSCRLRAGEEDGENG